MSNADCVLYGVGKQTPFFFCRDEPALDLNLARQNAMDEVYNGTNKALQTPNHCYFKCWLVVGLYLGGWELAQVLTLTHDIPFLRCRLWHSVALSTSPGHTSANIVMQAFMRSIIK